MMRRGISLVVVVGLIACADPAPPVTAPPQAQLPTAPVEAVTPCTNPFMPARPGLRWTFRSARTRATQTWTIDSVDEHNISLTAQSQGNTQHVQFACRAEGLAQMQLGVGAQAAGLHLETVSVEGVSIPMDLAPGKRWSATWIARGTTDQGGGHTLPSQATLTAQYVAKGREAIRVPAGKFDTVRVDFEQALVGSVAVSGQSLENTTRMWGSLWYAENTGLVKSEVNTDDGQTEVGELLVIEAR